MDINTRAPVHPNPLTTGIGDRDPGRNLYFGSQRKRHPDPTEREADGHEPGPEEPGHQIDVLA